MLQQPLGVDPEALFAHDVGLYRSIQMRFLGNIGVPFDLAEQLCDRYTEDAEWLRQMRKEAGPAMSDALQDTALLIKRLRDEGRQFE